MSEEVIKILDDLSQRFGIAIDWSSQNILPYLQDLMTRLIQYKNIQAIIWIVVSVIMFILVGIILRVALKYIDKYYDRDEYSSVYDEDRALAKVFAWFIAGIFIFAFMLVITLNIRGLIQNIYLPEATIIEYIKSLGV